MQAYLTWEIELANQIRRDDTVAFGVGEASASSLSLAWRAGRALLDLLLPPHCVACDAPVDAPGLLCADCFRQTGFITEPFCARCGVPFANAALGGAEHLCPGCRAAPPVFQPRPRRAALRRAGAAADPAVQARRPDRACGGAGAAHGARRRGAAARGGPAGAGAAASRGGCSGAATTRRRCWRRRWGGSPGGRACSMRWCAGVPPPRSARSRPPSGRRRWRARSRCGGRGQRQLDGQAGAADR